MLWCAWVCIERSYFVYAPRFVYCPSSSARTLWKTERRRFSLASPSSSPFRWLPSCFSYRWSPIGASGCRLWETWSAPRDHDRCPIHSLESPRPQIKCLCTPLSTLTSQRRIERFWSDLRTAAWCCRWSRSQTCDQQYRICSPYTICWASASQWLLAPSAKVHSNSPIVWWFSTARRSWSRTEASSSGTLLLLSLSWTSNRGRFPSRSIYWSSPWWLSESLWSCYRFIVV